MTTFQPSATIAGIQDRAMLVGVTIKQFNPNKTDKQVTSEVLEQHKADAAMGGKWNKVIISKSVLERIRKIASEIRQEHYRRTLPWAEDGARILTSTGYMSWAEFMRDSKAKFEAAVDQFISEWDTHVADARVRLNGMFKADDYPTVAELREKFDFAWSIRPVPMGEDFRVALGTSEVVAIKAQLQAELDTTVQDAMKTVWTQVKDVVGKLSERLKAYDPENAKQTAFRDTLVGNVLDLVAVLPSLNLTNDPALDAIAVEMAKLGRYSADRMRSDMFTRSDIAERADLILDQISQFIA